MNATSQTIERLERSLRAIAEDIEIAQEYDRHPDRSFDPEEGRHLRWLWAAAAAVVAVGAAGVWFAVGRPEGSVPATAPSSVIAETVSPAEVPPTTIEPASGFTVPEPTELAVLDDAVGAGPFTRDDPVSRWFVGTHPAQRWYVRAETDGTPTGGLSVEVTWPTEWSKSFSDGTQVGEIGGVELRLMADAARPTVGWRSPDGVRLVSGVGDVSEDEVIAAATSLAGGAETFDGFDEVAAPADQWTTTAYQSTGGSTWSSVSVTLSEPSDGGALNARITAFMTPGAAEQIGEAWMVTPEGGDGSVVFVDIPDGRQATVFVHESSGIAPGAVVGAVHLVAPADVPIDDVLFGAVPEGEVVDGGTASRGRWIVTIDTDPGLSSLPADAACLSFATSWAGGGTACASPESLSQHCPFGSGSTIDIGSYWSALVPATATSVAVLLDGEETMLATTVERVGAYQLAIGATPEGWPDGPESTMQVVVDGQPCPSG